MKFISKQFLTFLLCILLMRGLSASEVHSESESGTPFALVELFTSEGCSSCPPAEELFGEIAGQARAAGQPIFTVAFHVYYWDRLGWKDPFSDSRFTQRQYTYATILNSASVYTPQMIVNGRDSFVGSDHQKATSEIKKALTRSSRATVFLQVRAIENSSAYQVRYGVSPVPTGAVLNVAFTQDGLRTKVTAGENAGHTLHHEGVVRAFQSLSLEPGGKGEGVLEIRLPSLVKGNGHVIGYLQDPKTMEILGASAVEI